MVEIHSVFVDVFLFSLSSHRMTNCSNEFHQLQLWTMSRRSYHRPCFCMGIYGVITEETQVVSEAKIDLLLRGGGDGASWASYCVSHCVCWWPSWMAVFLLSYGIGRSSNMPQSHLHAVSLSLRDVICSHDSIHSTQHHPSNIPPTCAGWLNIVTAPCV